MKFAAANLLLMVAFTTAHAEPLSDAALVKLAAHLDALTRVTEHRIVIRAAFAALCGDPQIPDHAKLTGNTQAAIHVFVTPEGATAFKDPAATFPPGTVILKQKFPEANAAEANFYTGMLKREKGFNPDCGDWEFFTMLGDRRSVVSRGRIESCMDCHRNYARTDFVTKKIK